MISESEEITLAVIRQEMVDEYEDQCKHMAIDCLKEEYLEFDKRPHFVEKWLHFGTFAALWRN